MENRKPEVKVLQTNKKAFFNYEVLEDLEAGISLEGTEVKSLRSGRFSFTDSYVKIQDGDLWLIGFTIQPYDKGSIFNHEPDRNRRLLVHKQEIKRLRRKVEEKGLTIVPTKVYLKGNLIKIQVSLCRGKALHDKKEAIKERDLNRQAQREAKDYRF
ncbi:MAG: SsrA-binding protein SmpB [Spirochaetales bacterium]|nr:SsrA-binding protein SmpB [Spirochaetales bacterium]MBR6347863.1 SsrA-binding protein SmpB [Spirochaetales bacterium]